MDVDGALVDIDVVAPDAVEELLARKTRPGVCIRNSSRRNSVGPRCISRPARRTRSVSRSSSRSPRAQQRGDQPRAGAAEQRPHARHQLRHRERLHHIVVGAGREAADALGLLAARGQHDDRQLLRSRRALRSRRQSSMPERPGSIQSRIRRSGTLSRSRISASSPRADRLDLVALRLEIVAEQQRQRLLVLDDQDRAAIIGSVSLRIGRRRSTRCARLRRGSSQRLAGDQVVDRLGDVGGVVADPLDVLGAEQKMRAHA